MVTEAKAIVKRAKALEAQAVALAAQATKLDQQKQSLEAQAADLQQQGAVLQQQADALKQQGDELQAQANELQAQKQQLDRAPEQGQEAAEAGDEAAQRAGEDADQGRRRRPRHRSAAGQAAGRPDQYQGRQVGGAAADQQEGQRHGLHRDRDDRAVSPGNGRPGQPICATTSFPMRPARGSSPSSAGSTAGNVDLAAEISKRLPLVIITILLLSMLVLLVAFRSLLIPLQAAATNLLTALAAFGILTACFQWGWGIGLTGVETDRRLGADRQLRAADDVRHTVRPQHGLPGVPAVVRRPPPRGGRGRPGGGRRRPAHQRAG